MKKECRLKFFNIAFYAAIMGFAGLALASHKLEKVFKLSFNFSEYILYFTIIGFLIVSFLYLIKFFINFEDVKNDFSHPVKSNFFPGIGKILLLFSIGFLSIDMEISKYLWISGAIIQLLFTILILKRWILHEMQIKEMNPLWFIPVVGNIIAPIAGVEHGFIEASWFFYSVGFVLWVVLFTVIMNRIIFHNPLPQKLMPTLFILVAPGAIGFISYTALSAGEITDLGRILYYFSLFMFLVIISKIQTLSKIKFFLSWWAYSFPMAALTIATISFYSLTGLDFFKFLSFGFFGLLVLIIIKLFIRTVIGIKRKEICVEE